MRYEGNIFRPPSEAYSLLVQVTIGCTHNKCTFCSMYKDKKFRVRDLDEVIQDLKWAKEHYRRVDRIFLCDGDALALSNNRLMPILEFISDNFPECERVTVYGRAKDALKKTDEEMRQLYEAGIKMVYLGAESGSEKVLKAINKGETRQELIDGVKKIEASGMKGFGDFHIWSCRKRRMGGSRHTDRDDDKRDAAFLCWSAYPHGGNGSTYGR